jgi:NADH dehydrogenase
MASERARRSVVIVGAGFGGLRVARRLKGAPVDVTIVDRRNYHVFIPLLYQVATAGLEAEEIAQPVRKILRTTPNVRFRLATVTAVDLARRLVTTDAGDLPYDYLVLAAGSVTNYFGLESAASATSGLRDLDDAEELRDRILLAFERAAAEPSLEGRRGLMTIAVVGGGPTGVELAGALAELRRHVLPHDYPDLDLKLARVLLLEAADHLLPGFPDRSQRSALAKLRELDVEVRLKAGVASVDSSGVTLRGGEAIAACTVIWVAGMRAPPLAETLAALRGASGRIVVTETLQLPEHPEVFAIGDMAHVGGSEATPYPMMAPVAIQQGDVAAENIRRLLTGESLLAFRYKNAGTMATIGRRAAVAQVGRLQFSGFIAWVLWLTVHLIWLIGLRNRLLVLTNWAWNYITYDRGVRLIRGRR